MVAPTDGAPAPMAPAPVPPVGASVHVPDPMTGRCRAGIVVDRAGDGVVRVRIFGVTNATLPAGHWDEEHWYEPRRPDSVVVGWHNPGECT